MKEQEDERRLQEKNQESSRKVNALEGYRQEVIEEFEENAEQILGQLQAIDARIVSVTLAGSVLQADKFQEGSDIDLDIEVRAGVSEAELERIVEATRHQIGLGGGVVDVVGHMKSKEVEC
jgi:mevalonate kinase